MRVLICESYAIEATAMLRAHGFGVSTDLADLATAEALLVRSQTRVDKALLDRAPKLKVVVSATSGFDHLDWRAANEKDVRVAHSPEANADSTAELTMALMLNFSREIQTANSNVKKGEWRTGLKRSTGLFGQTLGVVGCGRIGLRVMRMANSLGLKILAHDPYQDASVFEEFDATPLGFTELLRMSDIVSLHVPLTSETRHLLNHQSLGEMQRHAWIVNTCRGPVVNENDLLEALDKGLIQGCAMDVVEREPPAKTQRLLNHPRSLITPHIGAYTDSAWKRSCLEAAETLIAFHKDGKLANELPLSVAWFAKT